ncbi:MAG: hypothetical protein Q4F67_14245 [Propionibacteriaceae bacterium]|nr:hypothetical protein [Propionibacteriaceae bacterium]
MLDDDLRWAWTNEHRRDDLLREQLLEQSRSLRLSESRRTLDISKLRTDLEGLKGSLETRVNALTKAFVTFVELSDIREQLARFPEHAKARRWALADLDAVLDGGTPPPRPEVPSYWLPPAVAALRPDGSLDDALAQKAAQLDPEATGLFHLVARAALGRGPAVVAELPRYMAPVEEVWSPEQLMLWAGVLRGAFGTEALPELMPLLEARLADADAEQWRKWAAEKSKSSGDTGTLDWVAAQIEEVAPTVVQPAETTWRTPRPVGVPDDTDEPGQPDQPEEESLEPADPAAAWPATRGLLVSVLHRLINQGAGDERALLSRATELRRDLDPAGLLEESGDEASAQQEDELGALPVVSTLRSTALDAQASPRDRRLLWQAIGRQFSGMARDFAAAAPPETPAIEVRSSREIIATPDGVDEAMVRRQERQIEDDTQPPSHTALWRPMMIGGALAVVAGLALALLNLWWVALAAAGVAAAILGHRWRGEEAEVTAIRKRRLEGLHLDIDMARSQARRQHHESTTAYEQRQAAAQRLLDALGR